MTEIKRGRPRREGLKRPRCFTLRVNDAEHDHIMKSGGSEFIRNMIFPKPHTSENEKELAKLQERGLHDPTRLPG